MAANSSISPFDALALKRLVRNLALTAVTVVALDYTIGATLRHFYFRETSGFHFRTTYAMESTRADMLVFGSSRANHHYVPAVFENTLHTSFYNTGRDGQGMVFQTALLKSVLKRYTPKTIIIEFDPDSAPDGARPDNLAPLLPYYRTHQEVREIVAAQGLFERIKLASEIYPFNSEILSIAIGNLAINKSRNPENKGYVALHGIWGESKKAGEGGAIPAIAPKQLAQFEQFLTLAESAGTQVFVIYSPVYRKKTGNLQLEQVRQICRRHGIAFFDMSDDAQFDNHLLFRDVDHLNHEGALLFSQRVAHMIGQFETRKQGAPNATDPTHPLAVRISR